MTSERQAIIRALALLDGGANNPNAWASALAMLPAGGLECEARVGEAVRILRAAMQGADRLAR